MVVLSTDIEMRFAETAGTTGNTNVGTAPTSLGGYLSTTQIVGATLHNLFEVLGGADNAASAVHYRCFFVLNDNATDTWTAVDTFIFDQVDSGASISIGLDPAGVVAKGLASVQAAIIANEDVAPAGVVFTTPITSGTALVIGNMTTGTCQAVWVRRTAANTGAVTNDGATVRFQGAE